MGLDPQSSRDLRDRVRDLRAQGRTILLTTHYMEEADQLCDRVAIIDHGKIVATGSSAELKQQTGTDSLEAAFLKLTGTSIRDEAFSAEDRMRQISRVWRK